MYVNDEGDEEYVSNENTCPECLETSMIGLCSTCSSILDIYTKDFSDISHVHSESYEMFSQVTPRTIVHPAHPRPAK